MSREPLQLADIEPGRRYALQAVRHLLPYDRASGVMSRKTARARAAAGKIPGVFRADGVYCLMGRDVIALAGAPSEAEAKTLVGRPETRGEREARAARLGQQIADERGRPVVLSGRTFHPRKQRATASAGSPGRAG